MRTCLTTLLSILALAACLLSPRLAAEETLLLRFPALHGHQVVFSHGGNLRPTVSLPGARFELDERSRRYRIAHIYAGQNAESLYRSPLTEVLERMRAQPAALPPRPAAPDKTHREGS